MDIGVPRERVPLERRVALTPEGARRLVRAGHRVWVERGAGVAARIGDEEYQQVGARLAYDMEEVFQRADLLLKIACPTAQEMELVHDDQILMAFLVLAVAPPAVLRALLERKAAAIALELIEDEQGRAVVLEAVSEIAGTMCVQIAARLLQSDAGGRGLLLGGAAGTPPATVVILGGGVVGTSAARAAVGCGARVVVLDTDPARLRALLDSFGGAIHAFRSDEAEIARAVTLADALIGAVRIGADRTPHLVSEAMVKTMKPGAVIVDLSVDQGGCVETIHPTTLADPTYVLHHVVHYGVPNLTSNVARTASYALNNARLPHVLSIAERGLPAAMAEDPGLARALVAVDGRCVHPMLAERVGGVPMDFPTADRGWRVHR